ncbi:MAG TPA: PucR family transcriptional regulator ligand-binding domain-containing protein [Clostridia bacterium]|nr:PucR family transcriptional regulator ligand-binding domain-containing protein [Clostridia bacterium]
MGLLVKDIIEQGLLNNVRIMAGQNGMTNEITWVNVMEILDSPDSIQRGELLVTTGYNLNLQERHADLIMRLKNRGVSGLAIQPGYYIDAIPRYILEQADSYGFPVLEFPKELTFSEILRVLIRKINKSKSGGGLSGDLQKDAYAFLGHIASVSSNELFCDKNGNAAYLLLVKAINYSPNNAQEWDSCFSRIRSFLMTDANLCHAKNLDSGNAVFLLTFPKDYACQSLFYELNIKLTHLSEQQGLSYYIGIDKLNAADQFAQALHHAVSAIDVLKSIKARRGVCTYENITFLKMFGALHQNDRSVVLENQALQVLLNYDRINSTNYVHTLRIYLAESCNVSRTAKYLFIHRHTLLKRLDKISELSSLNLENYYARIYMSVTLLFHDFFAY